MYSRCQSVSRHLGKIYMLGSYDSKDEKIGSEIKKRMHLLKDKYKKTIKNVKRYKRLKIVQFYDSPLGQKILIPRHTKCEAIENPPGCGCSLLDPPHPGGVASSMAYRFTIAGTLRQEGYPKLT